MTSVQDKPEVKCRCCDRVMDAAWQTGIAPGKGGHWLITCWQKGCRMNGYTFSQGRYHEVDLSVYRAK